MKAGDKVNYRRRTGYSEPGTIVKIEDSIATVDTEYFGRIKVHINNSFQAGSRDWIEPAK